MDVVCMSGDGGIIVYFIITIIQYRQFLQYNGKRDNPGK